MNLFNHAVWCQFTVATHALLPLDEGGLMVLVRGCLLDSHLPKEIVESSLIEVGLIVGRFALLLDELWVAEVVV